MRVYVPHDTLPKVVDGVLHLARHGQGTNGVLPWSLTIWLTEDKSEEDRIDFLLMKDEAGVFYYEALYGIELNGVGRDLRVYP